MFDLISSEYGWTDDQILDLTMERLRHVVDVILERRSTQHKVQLLTVEAAVKTMAGFVANTVTHNAARRTLVAAANKIQLFARPLPLPSFEQVKEMFGG